tara:strand:+ start:103 stop:642 length:540 start_codon:yes stop_codon:yes gene_type:complete
MSFLIASTMDSKSECKITYDGYYEWKHVYYQNKGSTDLNPNDLPLLDDEYLNDTGTPLYNDNNEEVFDPTQKIEYDTFLSIPWGYVYTSKTFIGLLQKAIKEFRDEVEVEDVDNEDWEFLEWLDCDPEVRSRGAIEDIAYSIGCKDLKQISEYDEEESYLWFTSSQLDEEGADYEFEEL